MIGQASFRQARAQDAAKNVVPEGEQPPVEAEEPQEAPAEIIFAVFPAKRGV